MAQTPSSSLSLTTQWWASDEKAYLQEVRTVRVAVVPERQPRLEHQQSPLRGSNLFIHLYSALF